MTESEESRYRDLRDVFERCINDDEFPEGQVTRLEIGLQASGEAVYTVWTTDLVEPVGGYLEASR